MPATRTIWCRISLVSIYSIACVISNVVAILIFYLLPEVRIEIVVMFFRILHHLIVATNVAVTMLLMFFKFTIYKRYPVRNIFSKKEETLIYRKCKKLYTSSSATDLPTIIVVMIYASIAHVLMNAIFFHIQKNRENLCQCICTDLRSKDRFL